jgi:hypothetical protein
MHGESIRLFGVTTFVVWFTLQKVTTPLQPDKMGVRVYGKTNFLERF